MKGGVWTCDLWSSGSEDPMLIPCNQPFRCVQYMTATAGHIHCNMSAASS